MLGLHQNFLRAHRPMLQQVLGGAVILTAFIAVLAGWDRVPVFFGSRGAWHRYLFALRQTQQICFPAQSSITVGDPLFLEYAPGEYEFAGNVCSVEPSAIGRQCVRITWRNSRKLPATAKVDYYETPHSLAWVARTLLPPEKRKGVVDLINAHYTAQAPALHARFMAVIGEVFEKSIPIIEKSALQYARSQQPRLRVLGRTYQEQIVQKKLIPVLRSDVMPIAQKHATPVLETIGAELWNRASLWRFGWRYAYDVLPLTERNLVHAEWRRFVKEEAVPVINAHMEDLIDVQKKIIVEVAVSAAVRSALQDAFETLLDDHGLNALVGDVLRHTVVNNEELHRVLRDVVQGENARQFELQLETSLQPLVDDIGRELFGTREEGLTPELVAVLRSQVLSKDERWLVIPFEEFGRERSADIRCEWTAELGQDVSFIPYLDASPQATFFSAEGGGVAN